MQVFDVVPFFDEIDLLEIRLETLNPYVDYFVISEFSTSFAGHDKKFHFEENKALFQKFGKKIMNFSNHQRKIFEPFANDNYQKNAIKDLIKPYLSKNDVIIFGDVDEIPNPALLPELFLKMHSESFFHFAQNLSYGYLNFTHTNHMLLSQAGEYPRVMRKKWLGSVACPVKMLEGRTISELRYPEMKNYGKRVNNGGWHFSYCGGRSQNLENRVRHKIINNAHQEFNNEIVHSQINEAFTLKRDLLGRREPRKLFPGMKEPKFKVQDLSELPDFISQNSAKLNHLIFPQ